MRIASGAHAAFAATMIALGFMGLINGDFTVIWEPVPKGVPAREALAYFAAVVSVASGVCLLWQRTAVVATRVLLAYLLLWLLVFRIPGLFRGLTVDVYWAACRTAVMVAGAWALYASFASGWDREHIGFATGDNGLRVARALYGLSIVPFGVAHFQYPLQTAVLVPGWLPAHMAWTYFTGGTFIAAGIAVLIGVYARLAAALSTVQMALFFVLVWAPRLAAGSVNSFQRSEAIVTCALTAAAWVVADSYRGVRLSGAAVASGVTSTSLSGH